MPKTIINYDNTIIYKIVCNDLNITDCYVGHTTNFIKRKQQHKDACSNPNNKSYIFRMYQEMRKNGGWDEWVMIEVEKYPCNDRNEATARERHWYEQLNSSLNRATPGRTRAERVAANLDLIIEKRKEYYRSNAIEIKEKKKQYRENNKEIIKAKKTEKITCICGSEIAAGYKHEHIKTMKHKQYLESIENI